MSNEEANIIGDTFTNLHTLIKDCQQKNSSLVAEVDDLRAHVNNLIRVVSRLEAAPLLSAGENVHQKFTYEQRKNYACKVCGNVPDEDGMIEHGKGCYTQSPDGGGTSWIEFENPCGRIQSPNAQFTQECPKCKGSGTKPAIGTLRKLVEKWQKIPPNLFVGTQHWQCAAELTAVLDAMEK